jgi:hypothetical protein
LKGELPWKYSSKAIASLPRSPFSPSRAPPSTASIARTMGTRGVRARVLSCELIRARVYMHQAPREPHARACSHIGAARTPPAPTDAHLQRVCDHALGGEGGVVVQPEDFRSWCIPCTGRPTCRIWARRPSPKLAGASQRFHSIECMFVRAEGIAVAACMGITALVRRVTIVLRRLNDVRAVARAHLLWQRCEHRRLARRTALRKIRLR